ncbi:MAG TPA: S41 family peptidase, partial [Longimicrobium sp.]|nr:S41 family peptidase [Longimicrobium sp.]
MNRTRLMLAAAVVACGAAPLSAQAPQPEPDRPIDAATRAAVVENVIAALDRAYVFPEKAREMGAALRQRMRRREYDGIAGSRAFADTLTSHLQAVSRDLHLRVRYSPEPLPPEDTVERRETPEDLARRRDRARLTNFGFEKVERLPGNVGYLEIRGFMDPGVGSETAVAAMNFLANTDALIIDLRRNGGGSPGMVQLVSSYLFDEPTHLNSLYFRPTDRTDQFWTLPHVPGRRFGQEKPIYVLTSRRTFSAAEEFTYNLQNLERATVVGDTTGGGAHPGGVRRVGDHFGVFVPSGRAINPVSNTNWEGTGVRPDVA